MSTSPETALFDVLSTAIENADDTSPLYEAELHATLYDEITKQHGIRIGDLEFEPAPTVGSVDIKEFDGELMVQCFASVIDETAEGRNAAREKARAVSLEATKIIFQNQSLNGAVCDCQVLRGKRGWAKTKTDRYAVSVLYLWFNDSGSER